MRTVRTMQQLFDEIVVHLRSQGERSLLADRHNQTCAYRGAKGCKCAIGVLIPDDEYSPDMESKRVHILIEEKGSTLSEITRQEFSTNIDFLLAMQELHDSREISLWETGFADVAAAYGLTIPSA